MKILYPLEVFYPSQAGGTANTVYWITKYLTDYEIEPIIIATDKGLSDDVLTNKWTDSECGSVIYIRTYSIRFPLRQLVLSIKNIWRADIVHLSSVFFPTAFLIALIAFVIRKPLIWSTHGELDPQALEHSNSRKQFVLFLLKKIIKTYPIYHSTCEAEASYVREIVGDKASIQQITNYFEVPDKRERQTVKSKYLLYIGRLDPKKAVDNLLEALSQSKKFSGSDFILKIAGTGKEGYTKKIKALVEELNLENKVEFLGQVEGESKDQLLANAYFTIMPSHTENFGLVVIESLAQETPVIASKGAPWKSLEDEKVGFWVDNSPSELGATIDKALAMSDGEYSSYRERGRKFVEIQFDVKLNIDKWVELYRKDS